jgi:Tryptophan dimethylallyltransferase
VEPTNVSEMPGSDAQISNATTLFQYGAAQLHRLQNAVGVDTAEWPTILKVYADMARSWGHRSISQTPQWSALTDDCSPFEFSIAMSKDGPELRMVVEPQSEPASAEGYWEASLRLTRKLETEWGADLARLNRIEALFRPNPDAWFAAAHGAILWPGPKPLFKIYLNARARGVGTAAELMENALNSMGLGAGWASVNSHLQGRGIPHILALDLVPDGDARVKIYLRFPGSTLPGLHRLIEAADPGLAEYLDGFAAAVYGKSLAQLPRPALLAYTLREGSNDTTKMICQIACFPFAGSDSAIADRVSRFLVQNGLDATAYCRAIAAMQEGGAKGGFGIQNFFSIQRDEAGLRVTSYLSPRVYLRRFGAIGFDPKVPWPSPVGQPIPEVARVASAGRITDTG